MRLRVVLVLLSILSATSVRAKGPTPVAPGSRVGTAIVTDRCPTFHWTAVEAESVDLVVYRVPQEGATGPPERVLAVTLPGLALGWTPSLSQCLEAGGQYAWSIGTGGEWSEASLFEVSTGPSRPEVEEALAVLMHFLGGEESARERGEPQVRGDRAERLRTRLEQNRAPRMDTPAHEKEPESPSQSAQLPSAPLPSSTPALSLDGQIHLPSSGDVFRDGVTFLWTDAQANSAVGNVAVGMRALQSTTSSTNTAVGHTALRDNTYGERNSAFGEDALLMNTEGSYNSAFGEDALLTNTEGSYNSAFGEDALRSNTTGLDNSAFGEDALRGNLDGEGNSAFGRGALRSNTWGDRNSAFGRYALYSATGTLNTAVGANAMRYLDGTDNTAVGEAALFNLTSGTSNIAIGGAAGAALYGDGDGNIFIGNRGTNGDDNTIRIGDDDDHDRTFIGAIRGVTTGLDNAIAVLIDSAGQLGTISSSRSVKQDIRLIGAQSQRLLELEPVAFRYRQHVEADPDTPVQFGLIAEEVAEVFPELVVYDEGGKPETVKYHLLSSLLLNELQKQHRQNLAQWGLLGLFLATSLGLLLGRRHSFPS